MHIHRTVFREDHEMFGSNVRRFFEKECVPRQSAWDQADMLAYPVARAFVDMRLTRIDGGTIEVMRELISRKL